MRFQNWQAADAEINSINSDSSNTFATGHNNTSDLSRDEFKAMLLQPRTKSR